MTNCWSTSTVVGMDDGASFLRNTDASISNCFNLSGDQVTKIDSLEMVNGALVWKLNGSSVDAEPIWYQKIGTDAHPRLFTGDVVYYYGGEYMNEKPVVELNSYAYALESASDAEKATISYALMSPAKAAKINFYAGGTKVHSEELAGDDLTVGTHSVEVLNKNLGEVGTEITFDVEVTSIGVKEASRVKSPTEGGRYLANAVRSMAFNDNTESTAFGTIYVVEPKTSRDELTGTQKTGGISDDKLQGLFAFTPTFEPILAEDGTPGFKGGLTYEGGVKVYDDNAQYERERNLSFHWFFSFHICKDPLRKPRMLDSSHGSVHPQPVGFSFFQSAERHQHRLHIGFIIGSAVYISLIVRCCKN